MFRPPPRSTPFPNTTLFRSDVERLPHRDELRAPIPAPPADAGAEQPGLLEADHGDGGVRLVPVQGVALLAGSGDRKSTRLNSSHANISYAVFCLKKKTYNHL